MFIVYSLKTLYNQGLVQMSASGVFISIDQLPGTFHHLAHIMLQTLERLRND